jgi:diguanylate cyclase (GGDEF)-like protein
MDFVRQKSRWSVSSRLVAHTALRICALVVLCTSAFAAEDPNAKSVVPLSPRAKSVALAQSGAMWLEGTLHFLPDAAQTLGGISARVDSEQLLAQLYTALAAQPLAEVYRQKAQADAEASGNDSALGSILTARIEAALGNGNYALCEKLTHELLILSQRSTRISWHAAAEEYLGVLDRRQGRTEGAAAHAQLALELREQMGDRVGQAFSLTNLGTIAQDRGDFARALDYFLQALQIREAIDSRLDIAYRNLALLYRELDDESITREYFDKALAAAERYADPGYYATVEGGYATFLNDTHHHDQALAAATEALSISSVLNNRPAIGFEYLESGRALLGMQRRDAAKHSLQMAFDIGMAINQREMIARSELSLAETALADGDLVNAHQLLDSASQRIESTQGDALRLKPQLAQAYELHDHLAEAEHDMATAHEYAHRYAHLREELLGVRSTRQLAAIEVRKAREQTEQQLQLAARTNELQAERLERGRLERVYDIAAIVGLTLVLAVFVFLFFSLRKLYRALAARNGEIESQRAALSIANERLEGQAEALFEAAITDPLTEVSNRAYLFDRLSAMLADCNNAQREMSLLMVDFDNFKQINDRHGHLAGDRILVETVRAIRSQLRPDSLIGRFGGEEFIVAFSDCDAAASRQIAENLRETVVSAMTELMPGLRPAPTISIGIALLSQMPPITKVDPLIDAADRAVYAAKLGGRNQVRMQAG